MKKELALVGCGKLADIIVDAILNNLLDDYQLIGVYSRTKEKAERIASKANRAVKTNCRVFESPDELIQRMPDFIVETASVEAMKELAVPALRNGISIITLSIGAFADLDFHNEVAKTAKENNTKVYIASGAIGGLDILGTATLMDKSTTVTFRTEKGPKSLRNSPVYDEKLTHEKREVFKGNAKEAIALFPTQVNVAVAAALASTGTEKTKVSIHSIPDYIGDDHRIEIKNEQVHAVIDIYSKRSDIAAWSVVNTLRNIASPIVF